MELRGGGFALRCVGFDRGTRPTSGRLACNGTVHRVGECEVKNKFGAHRPATCEFLASLPT